MRTRSNNIEAATRNLLSTISSMGGVEDIARIILSDKRLSIIRAPAGYGKTKTSLATALALAEEGSRVALFFRTHAEIENSLSIIRNLPTGGERKILVLPIVGKMRMCIFKPDNPDLLKWWCTATKCYFLNKRRNPELLEQLIGETLLDIDDYFEAAKNNNLCPYYFYIEAAKSADVILTTHGYFVDKELFEKLGDLDVVIIDEAHSFLQPITKEISVDEIRLTEKLLSMFKGKRDDLVARELLLGGEITLYASFAKYRDFQNFEGREVKIGKTVVKIKPFYKLLEERLEKTGKIILLSATLYPTELFRKAFNVDKLAGEFRVIKGLIQSGERRILGLKIGLSTSIKRRDKETVRGYINVINEIKKRTRRNVMVFTPSREFGLKLASELGHFTDGRDVDMLNELCMRNKNLTLVTYARSPISEGVEINLGDCEPDIAIIAGLPYPKVEGKTKMVLSETATMIGVKKDSFLEAYMLSDMFSTLIQCIGRIGRNRRGVGIIIDDRISSLKIPNIAIFDNLNRLINTTIKYLEA